MTLAATWPINDNVHGNIFLTEQERKLLSTRAFQRLRRIRQLSLIHYVFPTAEHSRFVHSLGVLAIADRMARQLQQRRPELFTEEDVRIVRLAALLHDIGHLPFSHLGEEAYDRFIFEKNNEREPVVTEIDSTHEDHLLNHLASKNVSSQRTKLHEEIGAYMVRQRDEITKVLGAKDAQIVAEVVTKSGRYPLLQALITSAFDADRLDYLVRDSRSTGVRYGLVDAEYLIRNIDIGAENGAHVIGIRERALPAAEHFLFARMFHYMQVVHHRTVTTFEAVARALIYRMIQTGCLKQIESASELYEMALSEEWDTFDDEMIFARIRDFRRDFAHLPLDHALAESILYRQAPRILCEIRDLTAIRGKHSDQYEELKRLVTLQPETIAGWLDLPREFVSYTEVSVQLDSIETSVSEMQTKDGFGLGYEASEALRLIDDHGQSKLAVLSEDSLLRTVANYRRHTLRVFFLESERFQVSEAAVQAAKEKIKERFPRAITKLGSTEIG